MIRNLKALGLVMVAAFATTAVAASAASAQEGALDSLAEGSPAMTLTGTEYGEASTNRFTAFGSTVECDSLYTGHKTGSTTEYVPDGATAVTVVPHYTNCGTNHVNMNNCEYKLRDMTTTGGVEHTYGVVTDLECPQGKSVFIDRTAFPSGCDTTIPPQTGLTGAHVTDTTNGHIDLHGQITGIKATNACFSPTENAVLDIGVTIGAHDEKGNPIGVGIVD